MRLGKLVWMGHILQQGFVSRKDPLKLYANRDKVAVGEYLAEVGKFAEVNREEGLEFQETVIVRFEERM